MSMVIAQSLMREAWRELMFADEDQAAKQVRDPVATAKRSTKALKKVHSHTLEDGTPTHSFKTLMEELATITRNTCGTPGNTGDEDFDFASQIVWMRCVRRAALHISSEERSKRVTANKI